MRLKLKVANRRGYHDFVALNVTPTGKQIVDFIDARRQFLRSVELEHVTPLCLDCSARVRGGKQPKANCEECKGVDLANPPQPETADTDKKATSRRTPGRKKRAINRGTARKAR